MRVKQGELTSQTIPSSASRPLQVRERLIFPQLLSKAWRCAKFRSERLRIDETRLTRGETDRTTDQGRVGLELKSLHRTETTSQKWSRF